MGLLPIKNWSTSVNIFVYVYIVCTLQNLNGETKKGKLFEKEVNHTDLLNTKEFLKSCSASNLYGEVLKMSHMNYKYMYVLVKLSRLYVRQHNKKWSHFTQHVIPHTFRMRAKFLKKCSLVAKMYASLLHRMLGNYELKSTTSSRILIQPILDMYKQQFLSHGKNYFRSVFQTFAS